MLVTGGISLSFLILKVTQQSTVQYTLHENQKSIFDQFFLSSQSVT